MSRTGPLALIISASMGGGHDGAAAELKRRLVDSGWTVDVRDFLDAIPARLGLALRSGYRTQLNYAPSSYDRLYRLLDHNGKAFRAVRQSTSIADARLRSWAAGADIAISVYPLASQCLGRMRAAGRIGIPVITYLTDLSVHPIWVSPGVDLHAALHEVTAEQVRAIAPSANVELCAPLVRPEFGPDPLRRAALRAAYGVPAGEQVALVVAGAWGVGAVERTVEKLIATPGVHPMVVCARNERLLAGLSGRRDVTAIAWSDDMPGLLATADLVVQNAGGLTSLEAFATGVPVLSVGCLPGHGEANAAAMTAAGLAAHACGVDLDTLLVEVLGSELASARAQGHARSMLRQPDLVEHVTALAALAAPPAPRVPKRLTSVAAASGVAVIVALSGPSVAALADRDSGADLRTDLERTSLLTHFRNVDSTIDARMRAPLPQYRRLR